MKSIKENGPTCHGLVGLGAILAGAAAGANAYAAKFPEAYAEGLSKITGAIPAELAQQMAQDASDNLNMAYVLGGTAIGLYALRTFCKIKDI